MGLSLPMERENYRVDLTSGVQHAVIHRMGGIDSSTVDRMDTRTSFPISATKEEIDELDTLFL